MLESVATTRKEGRLLCSLLALCRSCTAGPCGRHWTAVNGGWGALRCVLSAVAAWWAGHGRTETFGKVT